MSASKLAAYCNVHKKESTYALPDDYSTWPVAAAISSSAVLPMLRFR